MTTLLTMKGFNKKIDYLCFTANTAGSMISLNRNGSPDAVSLEISTDGFNWNTYTIGTYITLSNIWDKVYFRNTGETTKFSLSSSNYYYFYNTAGSSVSASGDISYLINKNGTKTLSSSYTFSFLFYWFNLTTPPKIPFTTLSFNCFYYMFYNCSNLEVLPELPAQTLANWCYYYMFYRCSKIKLSTTQTGEYQNTYRIPTTWTGTGWNVNSLAQMFGNTWWTFTWNPTINTTYYTSNTVV